MSSSSPLPSLPPPPSLPKSPNNCSASESDSSSSSQSSSGSSSGSSTVGPPLIEGQISCEVQCFRVFKHVINSVMLAEDGMDMMMQVNPNDSSLLVYFSVALRPQDFGTAHIIADADIRISVFDPIVAGHNGNHNATDAEEGAVAAAVAAVGVPTKVQVSDSNKHLKRSAIAAKPYPGLLRDYCAIFSKSELEALAFVDRNVHFACDFRFRVMGVTLGDPSNRPCVQEMVITEIGLSQRQELHSYTDQFITLKCEDEGKEFEANKRMLMQRSVYFTDLFTNRLAPDAKEHQLQMESMPLITLIRYVYAGEIVISQSDLLATIAAAHRYRFYDILYGITRLITPSNVLMIRKKCQQIGEDSLVLYADDCIQSNVSSFLNRNHFRQLEQYDIKRLLTKRKIGLNCPEIKLWNLTMDWLEGQLELLCQRKQVSHRNKIRLKKKMMEPLIPRFKFTSMSMKEFTKGPLESKLLTNSQIVEVLSSFTSWQ